MISDWIINNEKFLVNIKRIFGLFFRIYLANLLYAISVYNKNTVIILTTVTQLSTRSYLTISSIINTEFIWTLLIECTKFTNFEYIKVIRMHRNKLKVSYIEIELTIFLWLVFLNILFPTSKINMRKLFLFEKSAFFPYVK